MRSGDDVGGPPPGGEAVQSLTANTGDVPDWPAATPVGVTLPAEALRALPA